MRRAYVNASPARSLPRYSQSRVYSTQNEFKGLSRRGMSQGKYRASIRMIALTHSLQTRAHRTFWAVMLVEGTPIYYSIFAVGRVLVLFFFSCGALWAADVLPLRQDRGACGACRVSAVLSPSAWRTPFTRHPPFFPGAADMLFVAVCTGGLPPPVHCATTDSTPHAQVA